jgi:hypothetical protein
VTALNPIEVEQQILDTVGFIEKGVTVTTQAERTYVDAKRIYDRAWAMAYGQNTGSIKDKEIAANLATMELRQVFEVAEVAFHHAQRLSRALDKKLDALRSVAVSVRTAYAGTS